MTLVMNLWSAAQGAAVDPKRRVAAHSTALPRRPGGPIKHEPPSGSWPVSRSEWNKGLPMNLRDQSLACLAILCSALALPARGQTPAMTELRDAWLAGRYAQVLKLGSQIRSSRTNQTAELDYLIGTSACKLGQRDLGRAYLAWCAKNYDIAEADRPRVANAITRCGDPVEPERLGLAAVKSGQVGVTWRLKTYNLLPTNAAVRTSLPTILKKFTPEQLLARRVPIAQPERARDQGVTLAGDPWQGVVAGRFIVIGQGPGLEHLGAAAAHAEQFYRREYGLFLPASMVTIFLAPSVDALRQMAEKLHGFNLPDQCIGYSQQDDLSMVIIASAGTLRHELFHLMARSSFGDIPPWLDEGMAALYEVSVDDGDALRGVDSWRADILKVVQPAPPIQKLIDMDWTQFSPKSTEGQAINEATARYFLFYLQEQRQLTGVFRAFRERQPADLSFGSSTNAFETVASDTRKTLERIVNRPLASLEASFRAWLAPKIR